MVRTGQVGQAAGAVVTEPVGLEFAVTSSQLQRVRIVCGGPSWSYTGSTVLQVPPPLVEYCKVEPAGHGVAGAEMEPPDGVPPTVVQVLFTTWAGAAAAVRSGHPGVGQEPGAVVTEPLGLDVAGCASQLQRVRIVCGGPS